MAKPIIGRFSNEQLRFTRNTGYKRSDFEQDAPQASLRDVAFWVTIAIAIGVIAKLAGGVA